LWQDHRARPSDANTGWAVMGYTLLRLKNGAWSAVANPAGGWFDRIKALALAGPDDGWAVGDGGVLMHLSGETWSLVTSPAAQNVYLSAIALVGPNDGWAVGVSGLIVRLGSSTVFAHKLFLPVVIRSVNP